jgi:aminopeptidase N
LEFALEWGVKTFEYYTDQFRINYPLEKMDLISLPDHPSLAMENYGTTASKYRCLSHISRC